MSTGIENMNTGQETTNNGDEAVNKEPEKVKATSSGHKRSRNQVNDGYINAI